MKVPGRVRHTFGSRIVACSVLLVCSIAPGTKAELLYGIQDVEQPGGPDELVRVDPTTGVAERIHVFPSEFRFLESLTYDPHENCLWTTNSGVLIRVDLERFEHTIVGDTGFDDIDGLVVHPRTAVLYGVTHGGNDFVRIDKRDAATTLVHGSVEEGTRLEDLAFDPQERLFLLTSRDLVEIDPEDGTRISRVRLQGATSLEALVWDPSRSTFLSAADRDLYKDLVTIDPRTGAVVFIGEEHSGFSDLEALTFVPDEKTVPVQMQALRAEHDGTSTTLEWDAERNAGPYLVQRAFDPRGPWQTIGHVERPVTSRPDRSRYQYVDETADRAFSYRVGAQDTDGIWSWIGFDVVSVTRALVLRPNAPNPFNPTTAFRVQLDRASRVEITLFDVRGTRVRSLRSAMLREGEHTIVWDGRGEAGQVLPAGIYPYRVTVGTRTLHGQAVLVK